MQWKIQHNSRPLGQNLHVNCRGVPLPCPMWTTCPEWRAQGNQIPAQIKHLLPHRKLQCWNELCCLSRFIRPLCLLFLYSCCFVSALDICAGAQNKEPRTVQQITPFGRGPAAKQLWTANLLGRKQHGAETKVSRTRFICIDARYLSFMLSNKKSIVFLLAFAFMERKPEEQKSTLKNFF